MPVLAVRGCHQKGVKERKLGKELHALKRDTCPGALGSGPLARRLVRVWAYAEGLEPRIGKLASVTPELRRDTRWHIAYVAPVIEAACHVIQ